MLKINSDDVFNPELVETALFDGKLEITKIEPIVIRLWLHKF